MASKKKTQLTKYILHGGCTSKSKNKDNINFFKEITKDCKRKANVLLIFFADYKKTWEKHYKYDSKMISKMSKKSLKVEFQIAEVKTLREQIKWADVIYIRGGHTRMLVKKLSTVKNWKALIPGKTIAASSAGTVFSRYVYFHTEGEIVKGLGLLDIKVMCHYESTQMYKVKKLADVNGSIPLLVLPDYKYQVFYK